MRRLRRCTGSLRPGQQFLYLPEKIKKEICNLPGLFQDRQIAAGLKTLADAVTSGWTTRSDSMSITASGAASRPAARSGPPSCGGPGSHPVSRRPMTRSGAASAISSAGLRPKDVPTRTNFAGAAPECRHGFRRRQASATSAPLQTLDCRSRQ